MHLFGFIIRIYHGARSPERQKKKKSIHSNNAKCSTLVWNFMLNYNCLHFNGILVLASLFFSPEDGYLLADKFTKNTLNTACLHLYIYIYIYTHTHTYIYIYTHTHIVLWLLKCYTYLKAKHSAMDQIVVLLTCVGVIVFEACPGHILH